MPIANADSYLVATAVVRFDSGDEEYAVYSALLNEGYVKDRTKFMIIIDKTAAKPFVDKGMERDHDLRRMLSPVSQPTVDAFNECNKEPQELKGRLSLKIEYNFLGDNEWRRVFKGDADKGWDEFYKKYPGSTGFIRLSRVGFNTGRSEALVYVEHGCGATCGTGSYVLLTKGAEGWRVIKTLVWWAS